MNDLISELTIGLEETVKKQKKLINEIFDMKFLDKKIDVGINYYLKLFTNASEKKRVYFQVNESLEDVKSIF